MNTAERQSLVSRYWAKADPKSTAQPALTHHTLLGHSLDVAACAFVLIERNAALQRQLSSAAGIASESAGLTYAAVCALHDVGKLDTRFQRKAPSVADTLRPASVGIPSIPYDHGAE